MPSDPATPTPHCPGCAAPDAFAQHDHARCASAALAHADATVGPTRLTAVRRRALEILLETHKAMGAYDVLQRLAAEGFGHQPPVAYRALDFLVDQGLVHRIRRLNAFAACMHPGEDHAPVFLICDRCHTVAETPATPVHAAMAQAAGNLGFTLGTAHLEATGQCAVCRGAAQ